MRRSPARELHRTPTDGAEQELFDDEVEAHDRVERRMLWKEFAALVIVGVLVVVRQRWLE